MKTLQLYLSDLKELLQRREFVSTRSCLKEISPIDLADGWELFTPEERIAVFRLLTRQMATQLFEELDPPLQVELINSLQKEDAQELLQDLDPSEAGRLVRELPPPMMKHLIGIMKKGGQESVQKYLQFPPKTVGALMRGRYVTVDPKWTARQALERIALSTRLRRIEETHLDTLMVVDAQGILQGSVMLKELVVAPREMPVRELMNHSPVTLTPEMDQEEAVNLFTKYKLKSAPVTTAEGQVMGVVVYRDIFAVASEETEEDFAKMAGSEALDEPYLKIGILDMIRKRAHWLVVLFVGELLTATAMGHFEHEIEKAVVLALFIPLIISSGGNSGSQASTLIVRALALREVSPEDWRRIARREISSGLGLGLTLGSLGFIRITVWALGFGMYGEHWLLLATTVGLALLGVVLWGCLMGAMLPLAIRRLGGDPAVSSAPFVATLVDVTGLIIYFSVAALMLKGTLL